MPVLQPSKYAYFDENSNQFYVSDFWLDLMKILDPAATATFQEKYEGKIPLDIMVAYTQEKFLRKQNQRWLLEDYADFDPQIKKSLEALLAEYDQINEQLISSHTDIAVFLGTSTANLSKRAFYIFDSIVKYNNRFSTVIILGNDEPYDKYLGDIHKIAALYPHYFHEDIEALIPAKATMHETMVFVFEHLNWPEGKCPLIVKMGLKYPSNTAHEVAAVSDYLRDHPQPLHRAPEILQFGLFDQPKPSVTVVSNQPFNDRQGITALNAFSKAGLRESFVVEAAGPGLNTYPLLNSLLDSINSAHIVDNLTRTLYEINQNKEGLFPAFSAQKAECKA